MEIKKLNSALAKGETPSFRGGHVPRTAIRTAKDAVGGLYNKGMIKQLHKLGSDPGEILNILVTGIGTAFIAPIFIAFNPMSKEDKNTKIYSAMRQPISAVIAVAVQLGITDKYNKYIDKLASTGQLKNLDLSAKPQKSYLKQLYKLQPQNIEDKTLGAYIETERDIKFWQAFEKAQKDLGDKVIDTKADLITTDFYKDAKEVLESEASFAEKKAAVKWWDFKAKKELKKTITDEAIKNKAAEMIDSSLKHEAELNFKIINSVGADQKPDRIMKALEGLLSGADKSEKGIIESLISTVKNGEGKPLEDIFRLGKEQDEIFNNIKLRRFVASTINNLEVRHSVMKKYGGIILGLATLPFTCGALNWAYPRIMEKFMPEVANSKKSKEAKK